MILQGKMITIWSTRGNMGNTMTSIELAKSLSKCKGKTILVDMNLVQPRIGDYLYLKDFNHTLDNLFPFALGNNISNDIIEANCEKLDDLFVLKGTLNPSFTEFVKPEVLDVVIQALKDNFTYIVVDVHSSLNNSGTYTALQHSDEVYILLHRDLFSILSLSDITPFLFSVFNKDKFKLLFNKDRKDIYMEKTEIEKNLNMISIGSLPYIPNIYNFINKGEYLNLEDKKEYKEYGEILDNLVAKYISLGDEPINKKKKFKMFWKKK